MKLFLLLLVFVATAANAQLPKSTQAYLGSLPILLNNPSGENGGAGWVASPTGSITSTTSGSLYAGTRVLTTSFAASQRFARQDVTTDVSTLAGKAGLAVIAVSTNAEGIEACVRTNGSNDVCSTDNGTVQPNDGTWKIYELPFIFGDTSYGASVNTTSAVSGNFKWRVLYFNLQPPGYISTIVQSQIAVEAYFAGTTNCSGWTRASTTIGPVNADADCPGPTIVTNNVGTALTTDTDLPRVTVNNLPYGDYKAKFYVAASGSGTIQSVYAINDGTTTCYASTSDIDGTLSSQKMVECTFPKSSAGNKTYEIYVASGSGTITLSNSRTSPAGAGTRFILEYYPSPSQVVSSTNENYGPTAYTPTITHTSGSMTNYSVTAKHKRIGNILYVEGTITFSGAGGTFSNLFIGLPSGVNLPSPTATVPVAGGLSARDASTNNNTVGLVSKPNSVSNVIFASQANYTAITGTSPYTWASGDTIEFNFQVEIPAWQNPSNIVGSFAGVTRSPGNKEKKECNYFFGGVGATLASPTECTSGTCVEVYDSCSAGTPPTWVTTALYQNLTFAAGTWANSSPLDCRCEAFDVTAAAARQCDIYFDTGDSSWSTTSNGGAVINMITLNSGTQQTTYAKVTCKADAP